VKNHISSILCKLGVRDRTRAVLKALKSGYI
jgi:DNA-binding NarL/FixJ family response regulator